MLEQKREKKRAPFFSIAFLLLSHYAYYCSIWVVIMDFDGRIGNYYASDETLCSWGIPWLFTEIYASKLVWYRRQTGGALDTFVIYHYWTINWLTRPQVILRYLTERTFSFGFFKANHILAATQRYYGLTVVLVALPWWACLWESGNKHAKHFFFLFFFGEDSPFRIHTM